MDPEDEELFVDPEDAAEEEEDDEEARNSEDGDDEPEKSLEKSEKSQEEEQEEDEEEDARILAAFLSKCKASEKERGKEVIEETETVDRKTSFDPAPPRPRADRRCSLPCQTQLNAMQLTRLHSATRAPLSVAKVRTGPQELGPAKPISPNRRPSAIATMANIPEVPETILPPEKKTENRRFRRRNVMSLSDADRVCLICFDDLNKGGSEIRELECSHSFHAECIEERLWRKQECPTCRVHVDSILLPTSARVRVP